MPFVNIAGVHTADPNTPLTPKRSFTSTDPFAIVIAIQVSADVVRAGLRYDITWQMDNPRRDPNGGSWYIPGANQAFGGVTRDVTHFNQVFDFGTNFSHFAFWGAYADAVSHISGPDRVSGVFVVRGTINIQRSNLFAHSGDFAYKVVP